MDRHPDDESGSSIKSLRAVAAAALLRIEGENDKHAAYGDFVADLIAARAAAGKALTKRW